MAFVEFLRMRRALAWHIGILVIIAAAVMLLSQHHAAITVEGAGGSARLQSGMAAPLGVLGAIAAFYAAIFASSAGTSLNRESTTREISWTKPLSRSILALQFIALDIASVAVAFVATIVVVIAVLAYTHVPVAVNPEAASQLALDSGIAVMWYGLVQLLTFWFAPGARAISGILWPVALALAALAQVPGQTGLIARAVDVINPIAYLSTISSSERGMALAPTIFEPQALTVWLLAIVFCAIPILVWPRKAV